MTADAAQPDRPDNLFEPVPATPARTDALILLVVVR